MEIKLTCPRNEKHVRFSATAHVTQTWSLDTKGEFISCLESCDQVTHRPSVEDEFTCLDCGLYAKAEKAPEEPMYPDECKHCGRGLDNVVDKCESDDCPGNEK